MKRETVMIPGWDCGPNGSRCQHTSKGDHGQHCDDWVYVSKSDDGRSCLRLEVFAGNYPRGNLRNPPQGSDLTLHCSFPTWESQLLEEPKECKLVDGERCYVAFSGALVAREFFEKHGAAAAMEQTEAFWLSLEARHRELRADADERGAAVAQRQRCPRCDGSGICNKAELS